MRKQCFCICENKVADQLHDNRAADQRLCFRYIDCTIPLFPRSEISTSGHLLWLHIPVCVGPCQKPQRQVFLMMWPVFNVHPSLYADIDDCAGVDCLNGAVCDDEVGNYTCNCLLGYGGRHCETSELP